MKASIKKVSKYKSKYDNNYFDFEIDGVQFKGYERSKIRHLIQILDNGIE